MARIDPLDFTVSLSDVIACGTTLPRPPSVGSWEWVQFWRDVRGGRWRDADVDAYVDRVVIRGMVVKRPKWASPSQWLSFWDTRSPYGNRR